MEPDEETTSRNKEVAGGIKYFSRSLQVGGGLKILTAVP